MSHLGMARTRRAWYTDSEHQYSIPESCANLRTAASSAPRLKKSVWLRSGPRDVAVAKTDAKTGSTDHIQDYIDPEYVPLNTVKTGCLYQAVQNPPVFLKVAVRPFFIGGQPRLN